MASPAVPYSGHHPRCLPQPDMLAYDIWALGCVMVFVLTGEIAFNFAGSDDYRDVSAVAARGNIQHKLWVSFLPLASYTLMLGSELTSMCWR